MKIPNVVTHNDGFIWRIIEGEAILMSPHGDKLHSFNEVGTRVWELIDGIRTLDEIAELVYGEYEVEEDRVKNDIRTFMEKLLEINALIPVSKEA